MLDPLQLVNISSQCRSVGLHSNMSGVRLNAQRTNISVGMGDQVEIRGVAGRTLSPFGHRTHFVQNPKHVLLT